MTRSHSCRSPSAACECQKRTNTMYIHTDIHNIYIYISIIFVFTIVQVLFYEGRLYAICTLYNAYNCCTALYVQAFLDDTGRHLRKKTSKDR